MERLSSAMKGVLIRTPTEVCSQRVLLKGKYVEQYDQLVNVKESRTSFPQRFSWSCGRVGYSGYYWHAINMDPKLKRNEQSQVVRGRPRAQAILSPVSDPSAPTTKKVLFTFTGVSSSACIMRFYSYSLLVYFYFSFIYFLLFWVVLIGLLFLFELRKNQCFLFW